VSGLHFDIDGVQLDAVSAELEATPRQVKLAFHAALRRTATTLRTLSARGLAGELQLRTISLLRKRLKSLKLKRGADGVTLWYGLNDMPASWFKGTPTQDSTGASMRGQHITGAFVARSKFKGRKTMFKRDGKARLHIQEQNLGVGDQALVYVEDRIFTQTETIFWKNFTRELNARVRYKIGAA